MKYTITIETDDNYERLAAVNAVKNQLLLDGIYDEVFRPVIKYGDNDVEVTAFEMVWAKLSSYLQDD